jgi:hypothetical protein
MSRQAALRLIPACRNYASDMGSRATCANDFAGKVGIDSAESAEYV